MNLSDHFDAISFSDCGTFNFYQRGVAYALQQQDISENMQLAGASAGLEKRVKASKKAKESLDKEGVAIGMVAP